MIDKAPIQDQGMKDKAKGVAHQAIDKVDVEQVRFVKCDVCACGERT